jgi:alpha-L-rhamnosidase
MGMLHRAGGATGAVLLIRVLAVSVLLLPVLWMPPVAASSVAAAQGVPSCEAWQQNVIGPADRSISPVASWWSDGTPISQSNLTGVRLSQPGQSVVIDFGRIVSGKIEVEVDSASGAAVGFSSSESLQFLAAGGDTQVYGNGELIYKPGGGRESWHSFARRTFRYLLIRLLQPGWIQLDSVGMYFTALLGPPSAFQGYFLSSDQQLNSIWYAAAYTLQLVSAAGSSSGLDGTEEIWRGQLEMAAAQESRLLLAAGGQDWRDYTFDFDLTLPPGSPGGGWVLRATAEHFLGLRLAAATSGHPPELQMWSGTGSGSAALVRSHSLGFDLQPGRAYHVRVDAARGRITTSIDRQIISADDAAGFASGGVGFWAAAGDEFDVAHPRVYSADGMLLFDDAFDGGVYLDPVRWPTAPQPMLLDGAKRDRALGMADLAITARSQFASFGNWDATAKLLMLTGGRQYPDGKIPGGMLGNGAVSPEDAKLPDYTFWWILAVGDYFAQSGNVDALRVLFPHVQAALSWAAAERGSNRLLPKGPGEDWYWSATRGDGPTTALNALYVGSLHVAANLADRLDLGTPRDEYNRQAADIRDAMNASLWDAGAGAYVDGDLRDHHPLDGNALAVLFGVAPADRAAAVLSFLHDRLWTPVGTLSADLPYGGWAQDGAVWPAYVWAELEARFAMGDDANALEVLRRTWGSMLGRDPGGSFWEFAMQDGSIHDGSTSLAHGWSTGALSGLSRWVLGVRSLQPGYVEYVLSPHTGDVSWACGAVPTPNGPIQVAWQKGDGTLMLSFVAPGGTSGRLVAPPGASDQALLDGVAVQLTPVGPTDLGLSGLPSGAHTVQLQLQVQVR